MESSRLIPAPIPKPLPAKASLLFPSNMSTWVHLLKPNQTPFKFNLQLHPLIGDPELTHHPVHNKRRHDVHLLLRQKEKETTKAEGKDEGRRQQTQNDSDDNRRDNGETCGIGNATPATSSNGPRRTEAADDQSTCTRIQRSNGRFSARPNRSSEEEGWWTWRKAENWKESTGADVRWADEGTRKKRGHIQIWVWKSFHWASS